MPRQRIHNSRTVYVFPNDFPQRLKRFQRESGLTWAEVADRLGTSDLNVRRWKGNGVRPHWRRLAALLELAEELGLGHLFTDWTVGEERRDETLAQDLPRQNVSPGRNAAGQRLGRGRRSRNAKRRHTRTKEGRALRFGALSPANRPLRRRDGSP